MEKIKKDMTRDQAKEMFRNDTDSYGKPYKIMTKINMIYDDFEKETKEHNMFLSKLEKMVDRYSSQGLSIPPQKILYVLNSIEW